MATNLSIRHTLLESLFTKPRAINLKEFKRAKAHLFPSPEPFVSFLQADNYQEMQEHAKAAILHLTFHHHFPPPSRLLFNLFDFEEHTPTDDDRDFVPQDHFVHLVHLYLLGIYFFSYHRTLHRECATEFNRAKRALINKRSEDLKGLSRRFGTYEIFGTAWVMFVLYHDLGYPLEMIYPEDRNDKGLWLKPFSRIGKSILKDLSLKAITNLLVLGNLLRDDINVKLGQMYLDHHDGYYAQVGSSVNLFYHDKDKKSANGKLSEEDSERFRFILDEWKDAVYIRGIGGTSSLRAVGTLVPDVDLGAILENSISGEPFAFVRKQAGDSTIFWFQNPKLLPTGIRKTKNKLWDLAFLDGSAPGETYSWKYFAKGATRSFEENLNHVFGGEATKSFNSIGNLLERDPNFRAIQVPNGDSAAEIALTAYSILNNVLGYTNDREESAVSFLFEGLNKGFTNVAKEIPSILGRCVQELIRDEIQKGEISPEEILKTQESEAAVQSILSHLIDNKENLQKRLAAAVTPRVLESFDLQKRTRECSLAIRNILSQTLDQDRQLDGPLSRIDIGIDFDPSVPIKQLGDAADELDKLLGTRLNKLASLANEYRPSWISSDKRYKGRHFLDHGIASTIALLSASQVYQRCLDSMNSNQNPDAPPEIKLLRLSLGTTASADEAWLGVELDYLRSQVALAVALHNLYPSGLPQPYRSYRTKISDQPFVFLALLVDGLQRWDRKRLANPAKEDLGAIIPGSRFDVRIEGDLIFIYLRSRRIDFQAEEDRLRKGLRQYLSSADSLIRLQLIEA